MTHPLTDHIIESELTTPTHFVSNSLVGLFTHDDIRSAADWQLDKCTEELNGILSLFQLAGKIDEVERIGLLNVFKNAMRPQEEQ